MHLKRFLLKITSSPNYGFKLLLHGEFVKFPKMIGDKVEIVGEVRKSVEISKNRVQSGTICPLR